MPVVINLKGVEQEFKKLDEDLNYLINQTMRARAFDTLGTLKRTTPVDTGRARNSWILTKNRSEFRNNLSPGSGASAGLLSPPPKTSIEQLYITNGVDYIDKLNAGSSKQAPARFIENAVTKNFDASGVIYVEL